MHPGDIGGRILMAGNDDLPELSTIENNWYGQRRNAAIWNQRYGKAQNQYERRMGQAQQGWDRADLEKQYAKARQTLPNQFNQRGMMNSGVYQKALADWGTNRTSALARQETGANFKNFGFDLADNQMDLIAKRAQTELADQKIAYRQAAAAILR